MTEIVKFLCYLLVIFASLAVGRANDEHRSLQLEQACLLALVQSGFNLGNVDNYSIWMNNDTIMEFAQTGSYKGVADIQEYVGVLDNRTSLYIASHPPIYHLATPQVLPISATTDECVVAITLPTSGGFTKNLTAGNSYTNSGGAKLNFTVSPETNAVLMQKIDIFFSVPFLKWFWEENFDTIEVQEHFCELMETSCPNVFAENGYASTENCLADLQSLPMLEGEQASFDGKSQACRYLHASYAATNPEHCAHISFMPLEDPQGRIKCQESQGLTERDLFTEEELEFFISGASEMYGFDRETLFNATYADGVESGATLTSSCVRPFVDWVTIGGLASFVLLLVDVL